MRNTQQPRFTKKHYEAIAEALAAVKRDRAGLPVAENAALPAVERQLVGLFAADNPKFSPSAFAPACGHTAEG